MEEALKDERFRHILADSRFRKMPKNVSKITIDSRFKSMFKDKKFNEKCKLDKRGRPLMLTPSENLKKLYNVSSESSDEDKEGSNKNESKHMPKKKVQQKKGYGDATKFREKPAQLNKSSSDSESEESQDDQISLEDELDKESENANGSIQISEEEQSSIDEVSDDDSSSESDDNKGQKKGSMKQSSSDEESDGDSSSESDDDKDPIEEFDHHWEEYHNEAPDTNEITRRLAVCHMDWDRIRAQDLFVCFNSFKPADSNILSVKIYPSEYGLKRMKEEKIRGPPELVEETLPLEGGVEDTKGSKYHTEKLRQYQMNRLKYYYAVVECDSPAAANSLYEQLNGMEYESSSTRFDLRFIPDDMIFDQEPVSTTNKVPDPTAYQPRLFVTTALQQVKVDLTWDETDPRRKEVFKKAFADPDSVQDEIQDFLACSSDDDEEENGKGTDNKVSMDGTISKYKALLKSIEEEEQKEQDEKNKYELEITWGPGFREETEKLVQEKMKSKSTNPFEEILQKKKEERKLKHKEMKAKHRQDEDESSNTSDEDGEGTSNKNDEDAKRLAELALMSDSRNAGFSKENLNEKKNSNQKKKRKADKLDNFKCNLNDPRFAAIYTSDLFNIDPSHPQFKKAEGNLAQVQEKQRRLKSKSTDFYERKSKSKRTKYS